MQNRPHSTASLQKLTARLHELADAEIGDVHPDPAAHVRQGLDALGRLDVQDGECETAEEVFDGQGVGVGGDGGGVDSRGAVWGGRGGGEGSEVGYVCGELMDFSLVFSD